MGGCWATSAKPSRPAAATPPPARGWCRHHLLPAHAALAALSCGAQASHFLSTWGQRGWEFAVGLVMLELHPSSLLLVAVWGPAGCGTVCGGRHGGRALRGRPAPPGSRQPHVPAAERHAGAERGCGAGPVGQRRASWGGVLGGTGADDGRGRGQHAGSVGQHAVGWAASAAAAVSRSAGGDRPSCSNHRAAQT